MFSKIFKTTLQHKLIAGIILLLIIAGGYFGYQWLFGNKSTTQYVTTAVEKGTLIVSITGSGQVSVSDQVDIKPKVSGDVVYVGVKSGQEVKAGTLIVQLDVKDAQKAVHDAEISLERVKLDLEKMKGLTTDEGTIRGIKEKAADDLKKAYEDGFNTVANAFLELPGVMAGLQDILFSYTLGASGQWNLDYYVNATKQYDDKAFQFRDDSNRTFGVAREAYDKNFSDYKSSSRFSDTGTIERLIDQTYETTKLVAEAIKSANNLIQLYKDKLTERNIKPNALADTHLSQLSTYTGKTNSYLLNLLSIKDTIQTSKETIIETNFDIADQEIQVTEAENTLLEAKEKLAEYSIYAPFNGVIAQLDAKKGDSVSSATTLATLITKQKIAEITLNEIDVAKVKVGQKTTITFDAVEDLTITGEVAEIDTLGTVSQGVVTYGVKIGFADQDERVKPGMSLSVAIITDLKQDVLLVPNSAVKSEGNAQYVEAMADNVLQRRTVETGLSNDTMTEIISGLQGGEQVVTQTITANTTQTQSQSTGFRIPGLGGGR